MRTIIHSNCDGFFEVSWFLADMLVARGVASAGPRQIYSINFCQLHYAHYECFALSVSVHYVYGGCAMHGIAINSFD